MAEEKAEGDEDRIELLVEKDEKVDDEDVLVRRYIEDNIEKTKCGLGPWKPRWLQVLGHKEALIVLFSLVAIVQGMFYTYTVSVISTIEKRFKFTSKTTGVMLSGNEVSSVLLAMFLGYYLNYGNRPRWISLSIFLSAAASFFAALPHLIYGPGDEAADLADDVPSLFANGTTNKRKEELCFSPFNVSCEDGTSSPQETYLGPAVTIFISQFIVGISTCIFYSVGVSFLDDNINKKTTSFYYSVYLLLRVAGPILGFMVGGKCLSLWIDPATHPILSPEDPRWLGAWWLGFLYIGCGLTVLGVFVASLPMVMPETLRRQVKKMRRLAAKEKEQGGQKGIDFFIEEAKERRKQSKPTLKNMVKVLKDLFTNKVWTANLFNTCVAILAMSGYNTFKPKYLENQFRKSASEANYYTGMASMIATSLGTIISAVVLRWGRPGPRFVTGYNIFVTLYECVNLVVLMFIGCPKPTVNGPFESEAGVSECWSDCGCTERFSPVCSEDLTTLYYSPCYAGCTVTNTSVTPIIYSACQCVMNSTVKTTESPSAVHDSEDAFGYGYATHGYCSEPCNTFIYYIALQIVKEAIYATGKIGTTLIHLRCLRDEDKGIAIGTFEVFIGLFGFMPAPIIMGAIIDSCCLVWDKSCGVEGNCWLYDSDKFRMITHLVPASFVLVSVLGDLVMFHYSQTLNLYGDKDENVETNTEDKEKEEDEEEEEKTDKKRKP